MGLAERVAARYVYAGFFNPGDLILFGKYKNKKGKIIRLFTDEKGHPAVEIEPIPKGRKKNKIIGLFKIWHADKKAAGVAVDSGSLVVIDPAYAKYWDTGEHPELTTEFISRVQGGPVTQLHFNHGGSAAVLLQGFGGDGLVDVHLDEDEDVIVAIGDRRDQMIEAR